ncbi:GIY-YIG nuclease family protein [Lysinibacillus sphaericus]|uniref:Endonuclease n=3 Tax=Lysinibacillus TaxID=400634 RepID=A0A2S0K6P2_LYSSH|nr:MULTISPECIES: GIY-YIG nuclease family protein [Lysinibacillus]AHN20091.1 endonuclease [Lysinibacillus varians]AVK98934.1 endonuclease [Lysinibacillus sphaericus]MCS1384570.1 GIY-YIG nuclease family protein [Lysinibacillus sphaericus]MED4545200.1 GIY-YIG nuclease family protein [Lysinibacillus sphaericus]TKI18264.1 GIY-YIG nuclease family protein [Lysinibacillus sphaericus]
MDKTNSHFFYVLECADKTYYAGYTNNVEKRVAAHNAGKGAKYTRARGPVECIYVEAFDTKQEAMRAEYAFKQLTRAQKTNYIGRDKS